MTASKLEESIEEFAKCVRSEYPKQMELVKNLRAFAEAVREQPCICPFPHTKGVYCGCACHPDEPEANAPKCEHRHELGGCHKILGCPPNAWDGERPPEPEECCCSSYKSGCCPCNAERDALKARVGKLEQVLREVASHPYHDSDLASLLETLRVRAKAALSEGGGGKDD